MGNRNIPANGTNEVSALIAASKDALDCLVEKACFRESERKDAMKIIMALNKALLAVENPTMKSLPPNMLPPGRYIISDPCYVIARDDYDRMGRATDWWDDGRIFWDGKTGKPYAVVGTKYGDGAYESSGLNGKSFEVDAGCIACLPKELATGFIKDRHEYVEVVFEEPFIVDYKDGDIIFGDRIIHTGDSKEMASQ
jgi:hypothetical protein